MARNPTNSLKRRFSVGESKRTQISTFPGKDDLRAAQDARALSRGSPVQEPHQQNDYTKGDAIHNKDLESSRLQVTQEERDHGVADNRRHRNADENRGK